MDTGKNRQGRVAAIECAFPGRIVSNDALAGAGSKWTPEEITAKTGIARRYVVDETTTAADLAFEAASKIVDAVVPADTIDLLLFCTQSPDYLLPTSACILQHRLGLPTRCAAFDFNLGCSGYVYGLSIAQSMIRAGHANRALILTGETYSKWLSPDDFSVTSIFGDAGTATLVDFVEAEEPLIGPFVFGTDGSGADRLILGGSGARPMHGDRLLDKIPEGRDPGKLFMDGPEIFSFTVREIPKAINTLFEKHGYTWDDFDRVVFHQANKFMLDHLRKQNGIPEEKFVVMLEETGNTVSNTIPYVVSELDKHGELKSGDRLLLVGFGVGYSWAACALTWK